MDVVLLVVRLALASVFLVSGVAKLLDPDGTRAAFAGFGVPAVMHRVGSVALPLIELVVAVALVPLGSAWVASIAAAALMAAFTTVVVRAMAAGRRPDCHCFGQLSAKPIGWATVVRNVVLLGGALWLALGGPDGVGRSVVPAGTSRAWVAATVVIGVLAVLVVVQGVIGFQLVVRYGGILQRLDDLDGGDPRSAASASQMPHFGLPMGTPAPEFSLPGLHGEVMTLQSLRSSGRPVMLVFSSPNCGPCQTLMPDIGRWQADLAGELTIAVLSRGDLDENRAKTSEHLVSNVLLQEDVEVAELYRFNGTPNAVIIDVEGRVASEMAAGVPGIQHLVEHHRGAGPGVGEAQPRRDLIPVEAVVPSPVGRPAAEFSLSDLDGETVSLGDFAGRSLLMMFWNPTCGFCSQILDEVRRLEQTAAERDVPFVFVSAGSPEDNRAMGLRAPVLIDEGFATGNRYGAQGTPSAIVIDRDGLVASELAVGGPAVLALADGVTAETGRAPRSS